MKEGFDVGLEMSGNAIALRSMLANMCHGGRIAMLGIPEANTLIDWNLVVFNSLTIKGIYGREMYETWYKMTVMLQSGLNISPIITHRFHTDFEKALMRSGQSGKVILNWVGEQLWRVDLIRWGRVLRLRSVPVTDAPRFLLRVHSGEDCQTSVCPAAASLS
jgi:hypothetical protein